MAQTKAQTKAQTTVTAIRWSRRRASRRQHSTLTR